MNKRQKKKFERKFGYKSYRSLACFQHYLSLSNIARIQQMKLLDLKIRGYIDAVAEELYKEG